MKIDWSDLSLFLAVARGGGLAAGARMAGLSAPSLGRHMRDLERATGEILFNRMSHGYELTEAGAELLLEVEAIEALVSDLEHRRKARRERPPVHISAGTWMTRFLATNIHQIKQNESRLILGASEAVHNISRREATIGLRNTRPLEGSTAIRKTTRIKFAPYRAIGCEINNEWIVTTGNTPSAQWIRKNMSDRICFEVTGPRSLLDLARQGVGQVVLPCFVGDRDPQLARGGQIIDELTHDQWLVVHGEDRHLKPVYRTIENIVRLIASNRQLFEGENPK